MCRIDRLTILESDSPHDKLSIISNPLVPGLLANEDVAGLSTSVKLMKIKKEAYVQQG